MTRHAKYPPSSCFHTVVHLELQRPAGHNGREATAAVLKRDINARLLRYRGAMAEEYSSYSPDTKEILEAFTAGINAYVAAHHSSLPPEFKLAGFAPEPWKPEDCLSRM